MISLLTSRSQTFGPTWATVWWRIEAEIPKEWQGEEVHLLWDAGCEGLVWSADGVPLQGLCGGNDGDRRAEYRLVQHAKGGEQILLYLEMACNEVRHSSRVALFASTYHSRCSVLVQA